MCQNPFRLIRSWMSSLCTDIQHRARELKENPGLHLNKLMFRLTNIVTHLYRTERHSNVQSTGLISLINLPIVADNPIPMDVALPGGTFYRIQLGAFGSEVEPDAFRGISPITGERIIERGLIKYYAGNFPAMMMLQLHCQDPVRWI